MSLKSLIAVVCFTILTQTEVGWCSGASVGSNIPYPWRSVKISKSAQTIWYLWLS